MVSLTAMSLAAGSCVLINGLRTQAVYNGRYGVVCGATEGGRLTVRLQEGGHSINVKPDNLQKVCSGCRQVKDRLSACSRCKSAFFCGKDCMRAAWPEHKKECGKQPWLVNGPSLEQEIDDARHAFDRDDSDDAVAIRANEFLGRMRVLASARDHAGVVAARQEAVWAFSRLRAIQDRCVHGDFGQEVLDGVTHGACEVWHLLGHAYIGLKQNDKARQAFETRLAFCEERNLNKHLGAAHEDLGCLETACHAASAAEERFHTAKTLHRECGSKHGARSAASRLSDLYEGQCRHRMALDCQKEILALDEELWGQASDEGGDGSEQAQKMLANRVTATAKVASTLLRLLQAEEALAAFEGSRALICSLKDPKLRFLCNKQVLLNMGTAATCLGRAEYAQELWETLLEMAEEAQDDGAISGALKCLGTRHIALGNWGKATECLERALALSGGDNDDDVFFNLAMAQLGSGLFEESIQNLKKALERESKALYQLRLMQATYKSHLTNGQPSLSCAVAEAERWLELVVNAPRSCALCQQGRGDHAAELLTCGQCRVAKYCCAEHQRLHWQPSTEATRAQPETSLVDGIRGVSHKQACRLLKKWRAVKRGQGSRDDVRDDIVAFLDDTEISVESLLGGLSCASLADGAQQGDQGTIVIQLCGRDLEIPWRGPPPADLRERGRQVGVGSLGATSTTTQMKLDAANDQVVLILGKDGAGGEIPIPMHHFVNKGKSTGLFEQLLASLKLGKDVLPGAGKPFTQAHRDRLESFFSGGGTDRQGEIHRALAESEVEAMRRENLKVMTNMDRLFGRGDMRGVVALEEQALSIASSYEEMQASPETALLAAVAAHVAYSLLGGAYLDLGEHDKALAVYERSLQGVRAMALPDTAMALELQSKALGNQGEALFGAKRYAEAIVCYEQRLALLPRIEQLGPPFTDDASQRRRSEWRTYDALYQCFGALGGQLDRATHYILRKLFLEEQGVDGIGEYLKAPAVEYRINRGAPGWRKYPWEGGSFVYFNPQEAVTQTSPPSGWAEGQEESSRWQSGSHAEVLSKLMVMIRKVLGFIESPQGPAESAANARVLADARQRLQPIINAVDANPRKFSSADDLNILLIQQAADSQSPLSNGNIDAKREENMEQLRNEVTPERFAELQQLVQRQVAGQIEDTKATAHARLNRGGGAGRKGRGRGRR